LFQRFLEQVQRTADGDPAKDNTGLTPKQTSVFDAVFSEFRDSATEQLSGLNWRGFVS